MSEPKTPRNAQDAPKPKRKSRRTLPPAGDPKRPLTAREHALVIKPDTLALLWHLRPREKEIRQWEELGLLQ